MTTSEILMTVFTAVIATTGIIGTVIFNNQLGAMRSQLTEMKAAREDTRNAADAAKESATAAKAAVELADRTAEQQLRAYVFVDSSEIRKFGYGNPPEGWLAIKNSGATPAYELERAAQIMLTQFPAKSFPVLEWKGAKGYLAPHGEVLLGPIALPRPLTSEETAAVMNGDSAIYLFGQIKYLDAFKKARTVNFRVFFRGNGTPQYNTVPTIQSEEGNESN